MDKFYYIVVEEWLYPNESGRNVLEDWDTLEEALNQCKELAEAEENNFESNCKVDPLSATKMVDIIDGNVIDKGYIVSAKNGLDPFFYMTKIVKVEKSY